MASHGLIKEGWNHVEAAVLDRLGSPRAIQDFIDAMPYNTDTTCRSPREVLLVRRAHCMDGALLAAAALRRLGYPPLLMDLRAVNDDDHVVALYREGTRWGAPAKSNTTLLRMRDAVFRTLRELLLSYFPFYFNTDGGMSLRSYSLPLDLRRFDPRRWMFAADNQEYIGDALDRRRHLPLLDERTARNLPQAPGYLVQACFAGADPAGLFVPGDTASGADHSG
jgi:hypothetical protein